MLTHKMPNGVEITIPDEDMHVLRDLAERVASISALPEHFWGWAEEGMSVVKSEE